MLDKVVQTSRPQESSQAQLRAMETETTDGLFMRHRMLYPHQVDNSGKLKPNALFSSNAVLPDYGDSQIKHHGIATIPSTSGKDSTLAPFYFTDFSGPTIIYLPTCTDVNMLQFNCVKQTQHPDTSSDGCPQGKTPEQVKENILITDKQDLTVLMAPRSFVESTTLQSTPMFHH